MAFTAIATDADAGASITPTAADASNGNKYVNDGKRQLLIMNPDTASITCTIGVPSTTDAAVADGNAVADLAIATSAAYYVVKPLKPEIYNVRSGTDKGAVTMTWTGTVTNVTLVVI